MNAKTGDQPEKSKKRKVYETIASPEVIGAAKYIHPIAGVSALVTKLIAKDILKKGGWLKKKKNYSNKVWKPFGSL